MTNTITKTEALSDLQRQCLMALFHKHGCRYVRFSGGRFNRSAATLCARGLAISMKVNNDPTKYRITSDGCAAIGEAMPELKRWKCRVEIELNAFSAEAAAELARTSITNDINAFMAEASIKKVDVCVMRKKKGNGGAD